MSDDAIRDGLEALIRASVPGSADIEIVGFTPIVGGNSSQIWAFDARWSARGERFERALILRRAAPNEFQSAGREAEFRLLQALGRTKVPVPQALWMDASGAFLERPSMVLERVPGVADRRLLAQGADLELASAIPDILAAIHDVEVDPLGLAAGDHPAAEQLEAYDAEIRRLEIEPVPELRLASLWLRERLPPPPARLALVHGDFRPANLLVADGRITAVLDWEFAHLGDPAEDLGWYLAPYYAGEHFIAGRWSPEDFLARYEAARGATVDRGAIGFWSVFALYKLASMTLAALRAFAEGDSSRMTASAAFIIDPLMTAIAEDGE